MKWEYQKIGLSREQAEQKILSLGFKSADTCRGWELKLVKKSGLGKRRMHIVPSDGYMNIHEDTVYHKVKKGRASYFRIQRILYHLNYETFWQKVKRILL